MVGVEVEPVVIEVVVVGSEIVVEVVVVISSINTGFFPNIFSWVG